MIKLLSRLPWAALYAFSAFLYFLAFYVVRHRRHVIREQLEKVFPDLSPAEREAIHKQFLRNFCDVAIELLKSVSMSEDDMRSRMRVINGELARQYLDAGQSIMFMTSHLGNWEWLLHGVTLQLGYPVDAAYKPLHDDWAERLMLKLRSRFGARMVPAKELLADFFRRRGVIRAVGMNADQAPMSTDQRLLDPIPRSRHRVLRGRGADCARDAAAHPLCACAARAAQLLRSRVLAAVGRPRGAGCE